MSRISIFTGNYGSGKTEIAVNYALLLARQSNRVALVDLDIVNLYFRSRETKDYLEAHGVRVITPAGKWSAADLPAISPAILGVLQDETTQVVFDVGGDDLGATALGRFRKDLREGEYEMFFVVNACRPFTRDVAGIVKIFNEVQEASRLKAAALVSNTNLGDETTPEIMAAGHEVAREAARELGLPVAFTGVDAGLVPEMEKLLPRENLLALRRFMKPPWYEEEGTVQTDPHSTFARYQSHQKGGLQ